jgi:hypothetical protein
LEAQPATKEVVVLTSVPKELFEAYKQAFEQKPPGVKVIVKQQQTNQGVTYLRETRSRPEADIFWVSAVDAFQALKADGLLEGHAAEGGLARIGKIRAPRPTATSLRGLGLRPHVEHAPGLAPTRPREDGPGRCAHSHRDLGASRSGTTTPPRRSCRHTVRPAAAGTGAGTTTEQLGCRSGRVGQYASAW